MDDIWTPADDAPLGDLAAMDYADLVDLLRKDLQLDAATDLQPGAQAALLNLGLDRGSGTLTFSASASSAPLVVNHRLGVQPASVVAISSQGTGVGINSIAKSAGTFTVIGWYPFGSLSGTISFDWIATR